jgi:hypothetical protein
VPWTIAALVVVGFVVVIDDPLRDFTTNHASLEPQAADPYLQPAVYPVAAAEMVDAIRRAGRRIKDWDYVGTARLGDAVTVVFERSSRIWPFTDDIRIRVEDLEDRCRLTAEASSRTRFGDLGRSPRNLRRLRIELATVLERDGVVARPAFDTLSR